MLCRIKFENIQMNDYDLMEWLSIIETENHKQFDLCSVFKVSREGKDLNHLQIYFTLDFFFIILLYTAGCTRRRFLTEFMLFFYIHNSS